jgi:hypothetical protein
MRCGAFGSCAVAIVWLAVSAGSAQQAAPRPGSPDPRVGLKAGFRDAGVASLNMTLVSTLPKPDGFFDPGQPAGAASPPEPAAASSAQPPAPPPMPQSAPGDGLAFANSDLAFRDTHLFMGNFHGFNTYDIENANRPRLLASVVCPGGQGDVSVHGNLLFMSVEQTRGRVDCGTEGVAETASAERFRGIRIFDITDLAKPKQVAAVQTCRGSHTHSLVTDRRDPANLYVYGSGTSTVRPGDELAGCADTGAEDPNTALFSIDVIRVPLAAPQNARIVNRPRIFADDKGNLAGLWRGGDHGPGTQPSRLTAQCHDITVYPEVGLAAGACSGNGILLDISDPVKPVRIDHVTDKNFAAWHSATFNNAGTKVVFTDEWGGGTRPRCRAADPIHWGGNAIFDIVDRKLVFRSYYKMPAAQTESENCVAHNGSIIPVPGRDIMVQGWYQGGVSVFDFTDSANPVEIAFFDRGPLDADRLITGGYWSTYWYNGHIYGAEIARGLDVFRLTPSEHLTQNEIAAASQVRMETFNAQEQPRVTWPDTTQVARAYLDQLVRRNVVTRERATSARATLVRVDQLQTGRERSAETVLGEVDRLAAQFSRDADTVSGQDQVRLRALSDTLTRRVARLRQ